MIWSLLSQLIAWVDRPLAEDDAVARARNRVQHLVVGISVLVGVPYAGLLFAADNPLAAGLSSALPLVSGLALFVGTRRGMPQLGGAAISLAFLLGISVVLVSRGGLHSNSSIWLMLVPVMGVMTTGPRYGVVMGALVAVFVTGLWTVQSSGVVLPTTLSQEITWLLVVVDHVTVPLAVAFILWGQSSVWARVVTRLDEANEALRSEVAERKSAEQRALDAARARTTFLATMSHEIRTPLNGVLGVTDAMLDGELSGEQRQLATTVQQSGELLRTVLDDVLDFSKIDSGQLELTMRPVQLSALGHQLHRLWTPRASERGCSLRVEVDPELPGWALFDTNRLRQVLNNLLSNAIKFTDAGAVSLRMEGRGDHLHVAVEDSGVGIENSELERIFMPFQQLDGTDTRRHGGTGLGLAICRRLVDLMDGQLQVRSTVGQGSTFWFDLPLQPTEAPVLAGSQDAPKVLAGRRVLAAEDNPINQVVLRKLLGRAQVSVRLAADGQECIEMCEHELPELILMDCQMPGCDGYEATRRLRMAGVRVPIIAVTASTMPGDRQRCLDAGMDDHLSKPVRAAELEAMLVKWLERRQAASAPDI